MIRANTFSVEGRKRSRVARINAAPQATGNSNDVTIDAAVILRSLADPVAYMDSEAKARKPWERAYGSKEDGDHTW